MILGYPFGLIGLLSVPVILALHLLHRRQQPYVVSHLGLWNFLESQARGPRARRIPITLILLLDLLIGVLLSLAWAQPRITLVPPASQPKNLVILIDTSSSMRAKDAAGFGSRLDRAKAEVSALLKGVGPRDVVTILGFGQHARLIGSSRPSGSLPASSLAQLTEQIDSLPAGETGTDTALAEALASGQASLDRSLPADFHIITDGDFSLDSDMQAAAGESASGAAGNALGKFAYPLHWHLVGGAANNQAVIDLNATPLAGNQLQVFARIANFSDQEIAREAVLEVDGRQIDQAAMVLPANAAVPHVWQVPAGNAGDLSTVVVSLKGTDDLKEDDSAAIGLQTGGKVRVALVAEPAAPGAPDAIQQAVQAIPGVDLKRISPAEYAGHASAAAPAVEPYDLTIFRGFLPSTWPGGVALVVDPPVEGSGGSGIPATGTAGLVSQSERRIPASAVAQAGVPDPLVDGIDFSGVRWSRVWTLASTPPGFTPLLQVNLQANTVPILLQGQINPSASGGNGDAGGSNAANGSSAAETSRVVVLLADLTTGNFTKHPAFPILIANLVESARRAPLPTGFKTGEALPLPAAGSYQSIAVTAPQQSTVDLGSRWPSEWTDTLEPGLYRFRLTRSDGGMTEFYSGASAGDALESDLRPRSWTENLAAGSSLSGAKPVAEEEQIDLRPWLLGAAILALVTEAALAWHR